MSAQAARLRYLTDQVGTATPASLIVALYDRLGRDIELGVAAMADADPIMASEALSHAQRIVTELLTSLNVSAWSGGEDLARLYRYMLMGLIDARTARDSQKLASLGEIVAQLRSAWQQAAVQLVAARSEATSAGQPAQTYARLG